MRPEGRTVERELARLAGDAHGVVTREEMLAAGITLAEIKWRVGTGALLRVHRSVYRVGHRAPSVESLYMAAVKAGGFRAALCGRAAGHLLGVLKGSPPAPDVITATDRRIAGVRTRRSRGLGAGDVMTWRGIPVTSVPLTLVHVAAVLAIDELALACHEAGIRHGTSPDEVEAVLSRWPTSPGAGRLRRVLHGDVPVTLSTLEARFLALLRKAGLPAPQTNRRVGGRRVDCRWEAQRLTVEIDGYRYHRSRHAWEQDRRREREARARGDEFRRYTYGDIVEDPRFMLAELCALLPGNRPAIGS